MIFVVLWSWFKSSTALNPRNLLPSLPVVAQIAWNIGFALQKCFDVRATLPLHCTTPVKPPGIAQPGALTCQLPPLLSIPKTLGANPSRLFLLGYSSFFLPKVRSCVNCQETPNPRVLGLLKFTLTPEQLPKTHLESFICAKNTRGACPEREAISSPGILQAFID